MKKCKTCDGKGLLRLEGTNLLVPCLKCKEQAKECPYNGANHSYVIVDSEDRVKECDCGDRVHY